MASIPTKTQTIQFTGYGGPEVIKAVEIDTPIPKGDEVLVRIEWSALNFLDTRFQTGATPVQQHPLIAGIEASGEIISLPTVEIQTDAFKNKKLSVGDKVVFMHPGTFATYIAVPSSSLLVIPRDSGISTKIAVGGFSSVLTALPFLKEAYEVKKGDWVLVTAAAGGLGIMLCQIGKLLGANVIGTTSTAEKADIVRAHGADHVFLNTEASVVDEILKLTDGQGVQAIFDSVGKDIWEDNFNVIARKGTIVVTGASSGVIPALETRRLMSKNVKLVRPSSLNYLATPSEFAHYTDEYLRLLLNGNLKVNIHKEYPLSVDGISQSLEDLRGRGTVGKLLINVGADEQFQAEEIA